MRILVVEDESRIAADVGSALREAGYACDFSSDGDDAWFKGDTEPYDLVVLDLGLPQLDGLTVLKRWREAGRTMPVAHPDRPRLLAGPCRRHRRSAPTTTSPKPFQMPELVARARGLIRRSAGHASAIHRGRPDLRRHAPDARHRRRRDHVPSPPSNTASSRSSFTTKAASSPPVELLDHLYGDEESSRETNALEALVMRTRKKLGPNSIETRRGFGYLIADGER